MRVLIGCEYSGIVRDAFLDEGHCAFSCDLEPAESKHDRHLREDIVGLLKATNWDLVVLHPPCTALAVCGNGTYAPGGVVSQERLDAIKWTVELWYLALDRSKRVALENPVGVLSSQWRPPDQYIQPWQFGHGETKKTGLWLHNLPRLTPTNVVEGREQRIWKMPPSDDRGKERSRFYEGIAKAMATQWSLEL